MGGLLVALALSVKDAEICENRRQGLDFTTTTPTRENYWRSIILFGRNVASYKFALAKSLIDLKSPDNDLITLDKLSEPFSRHLCEHIASSDKQATSSKSQFLDSCREFIAGSISEPQLHSITMQKGFNNVIDAFHVVGKGDIPVRFFIDERKESGGIRVTDDFYELFNLKESDSLADETEARWRLVETAWELNISRNLISVSANESGEDLYAFNGYRRIDITSSRDALNGYQKGTCFYCSTYVDTLQGSKFLADVDHFVPHRLKEHIPHSNLDGVWNLVLACRMCNRGADGKFDQIPIKKHLENLHRRNEYLIKSHHPLKETLIRQTGRNERDRGLFLQKVYDEAHKLMPVLWDCK